MNAINENTTDLALRIDDLAKEIDPYGYNDEVDDPIGFVEYIADQIECGNVDVIVAWFEDCDLDAKQQKELDDIKRELNKQKKQPLENAIQQCSEKATENKEAKITIEIDVKER